MKMFGDTSDRYSRPTLAAAEMVSAAPYFKTGRNKAFEMLIRSKEARGSSQKCGPDEAGPRAFRRPESMKQSTLDGYQPADYKNADWLREQYYDQQFSVGSIAERSGVSNRTIRYWMDKFDIKRRSRSDAGNLRWENNSPEYTEIWQKEDWLRERYVEEKATLGEMADDVGVSLKTISNHMERHGIPRRDTHESGFYAGSDTGFVHADSGGYEVVWDCVDGEENWCRIHRLLAVAEFGLEETAEKLVHHKNGVPWDNRAENVQLMSRSGHGALHDKDRERDAETGQYV